MSVERLGFVHAAAMARVHELCFDTKWREKDFQTFLALPTYSAYGWIEDSNALAGFILYNTVIPEIEVSTICVAPDYRRRGIAKMIFEQTLDKIEGVEKCFLEVAANNESAISLYSSLGFSISGIRKNYYRMANGDLQHAVLMHYDFAPNETKERS